MQPSTPAVASPIAPAPPPVVSAPRGAAPPVSRPARRRRLLVFALALAALLVVVGGEQPSEAAYLTAAAQAKTSYRYDHALSFYAAAAQQNPTDGKPYCLSGDVLTRQQELKSAVGAYLRCTQISPNDGHAWLSLGDARQAIGDTPGAMAAWQTAAQHGDTNALRRLGLAYEQQQRFDDALADWQRLPADDPEALEHLGLLALWSGDTDTARTDLVAAGSQPSAFADELDEGGFAVFAALPPTTSDEYGRLGYAFLRVGMTGLALRPLRTAIILDPQNGDAHAYLGWALWQKGQATDARAQLALGRQLSPRLAFGWYASGEVAANDGKLSDAENDFLAALTYDGKNSLIWDALGHVQRQLREYYKAELAFENAATLSGDPRYTVDWLHYFTDYHIGFASSDTARYAANTALKSFPDNGAVHALVGDIYDLSGLVNDAYVQWRQALTLDPTLTEPYVGLARYAENQGDFVEAAWELRTALALEPDGPDAPQARAQLAIVADIQV